jgi:uncharacterized repeat protein (TIGR03803 family)
MSALSSAFLAFLLSVLLLVHPATAQNFQVLYNFGGSSDGGNPYASLIADSSGNLYGTASAGGSNNAGVVFTVNPSGTETVLYSFTGGTDGAYPFSALVRDIAGNLYGTTSAGGTDNDGVVFMLDPNGEEVVLHNFTGGTDGTNSLGGLLRDKSGNLFGTTSQGGSSNEGIVFEISASGAYSILHTFTGATNDGAYPTYTSLLMDAGGTLYGVTEEGGTINAGVVYKLSKTGKFNVLYSFTGGSRDGCYVLGTPFMDKEGAIYGTGSQCGASEVGTVWKLTKSGEETVLHNFAGGTADGEYPFAGVIVDAEGNVYGNTKYGGASGVGTVYRIATNGKETLLHSFDGADGKYPYGNFAQNPKGTPLFGITENGGTTGSGVVWKITR